MVLISGVELELDGLSYEDVSATKANHD